MKIMYFTLAFSLLYNKIAHFSEYLEFLSGLNYLALALIGFGMFVLRHLGRTVLVGKGGFFSLAFIGKAVGIIGMTIGIPLYIQHMLS